MLRDLIRRAGAEGRLHLLETSTRTVVEDLAGAVRTHRSVYVAWRRLADAGVIRIERQGRGTTGSLISLLRPSDYSPEQRDFAPSVSTPPEGEPPFHPSRLATPQSFLQHQQDGEGDLLTALSPAAIETYHLLLSHGSPLTTNQLAAALGMRPRSLRRVGGGHLGPAAILAAVSLVERCGTGQWRVRVRPDLGKAVAALDACRPRVAWREGVRRRTTWRGALDQIHARHELERENYASWLRAPPRRRSRRRRRGSGS